MQKFEGSIPASQINEKCQLLDTFGIVDDSMDLHKAKFLALQLCEKGVPCTIDELCKACQLFPWPVTPLEIRRLCELPDGPLRLLDSLVCVTTTFPLNVNFSYFRISLEQNNVPENGATKQEDSKVVDKGLQPEHMVSRADFIRDDTIKEESAVAEVRLVVDGSTSVLVRAKRITAGGSDVHHHDVNHINLLERTEKSLARTEKPLPRTEEPLATTAAACPAIQGRAPVVNEATVEPKQKSRERRIVPRFDDFTVESEVGAGGYGTVYKVRRLADGRVFAIKCPLENTHVSCVRNEINMLKRLRGKNFIIQFESEVNGKVGPKPEAGGDKETDCLSILLEFVEHDKPEVLKKEITVEELRSYSSSLFRALAQLHEEKILHLDVKPGNFLFSRSNMRGCLVDFNLARVESVNRHTAKRPPRACYRPGDADAKTFERKTSLKRSLVHEDTTLSRVNPSKRSRQLLDRSNVPRPGGTQVGTSPAKTMRPVDESKETFRPASTDIRIASPKHQQVPQSGSNAAAAALTTSVKLQVKESHDDAGNIHRVEIAKTQEPFAHGFRPHGGHPRLMQYLMNNVYPLMSQTTQRKGVPALKGKGKRVGAEVPAEPRLLAQSSNVTKVKAAIKGKAQCHPFKDGPCVGTKGYRAPEVLMRSLRQTTKVDIWSAGVSLLQLVTGRSPFPSTSTDGALKDIAKLRGSVKMEAFAKSLGQRRRFSKDICPGIPVKDWSERQSKRPDLKGAIPWSLYDLIEKCLEVDPDTRITAKEALAHQFFAAGTATPEVPIS